MTASRMRTSMAAEWEPWQTGKLEQVGGEDDERVVALEE